MKDLKSLITAAEFFYQDAMVVSLVRPSTDRDMWYWALYKAECYGPASQPDIVWKEGETPIDGETGLDWPVE